jgi:transposase
MGTYPQEFKDQLVELHRQGRPFAELAREFNVSATTVANWTRAADRRDAQRRERTPSSRQQSVEPVESDLAKIARLERELAAKADEVEILGKALAFFVRRSQR